MDYKISKRAYDVYAPVTLTNEVPPMNVTGIRNRQLQLDWANDLIGYTKINYVDKESEKYIDGVRSPNYKPEYLRFYDIDSDQIIEGFLDKVNFEIGGNFVVECDYLMHEFHKYLFRLYPEHQNTLYTLTKNERQDYFNEVGSMIHSYWDSSRLLYNDEDELLYLQHKLYTKLNAVRQSTGTAKNYEDLLRLIGIKWAYAGFKLFDTTNGTSVPSLKEDVTSLELITDLLYHTREDVIIGSTLRILKNDDLQSPFQSTCYLNIAENIDSFREFQVTANPMDFEEVLNNVYAYGVPYKDESLLGSISPNITTKELIKLPSTSGIALYDKDKEFQYLMRSSDGEGVIPFVISAGDPKFDMDFVKEWSNTYLRTRTTLREADDPKAVVIKTAEIIWDVNFLRVFADKVVEHLKYTYEHEVSFKEKIDGVYRLLQSYSNNYLGRFTINLYNKDKGLIIRAVLKEEVLSNFKDTVLDPNWEYDYKDIFEYVSYPEASNSIVYDDGVYLIGTTIHLITSIDRLDDGTEAPTTWNEHIAEHETLASRDLLLVDPKILTNDPDWCAAHNPKYVKDYGIEEITIFELEDTSQNTVSVRIDSITKVMNLLDNVESHDILVNYQGGIYPVKQISVLDINNAFDNAIRPETYTTTLFNKINVEHQVINKKDCEYLANGTIKIDDLEIEELLKIKGQLHFGLLLQGKRHYGLVKDYHVEKESLIIEIGDMYPVIEKDEIYNPKGQFFYVNDMFKEGEFVPEDFGRRACKIVPCIYKGSIYYKCLWEDITKPHLNYYMSNIFSDKTLYTEEFIDLFRSNNTARLNTVVDTGEVVIYDTPMDQGVIKEFIEENKSVYRSVSLLKLIHIPLVLNTVMRSDDYHVTTAAYSNVIPVTGAFYNVDLTELPKLTDFIDNISDEDYSDIKVISDITGSRLVTWGNAIWDTNTTEGLKRFRAIWSGYFTSFEITLTSKLFPEESELESLIDSSSEYEQSFILSPYNVSNYTKDRIGKWDIAFVIPDSGSTAIKFSKLYDYSGTPPVPMEDLNVGKAMGDRSIPTLNKEGFLLGLDDLKFTYKNSNCTLSIDKVGNSLVYTEGDVNWNVYSLDYVLHLEKFTNNSYFNYTGHPEVTEILNYWLDKRRETDPEGTAVLSSLPDKTCIKTSPSPQVPAVAIVEEVNGKYELMIYVIREITDHEVSVVKFNPEMSIVPIALLFNVADDNTVIRCERKASAKILRNLLAESTTLVNYPYFITQDHVQFIQDDKPESIEGNDNWRVDDNNPAIPILGKSAFTYRTFIPTDTKYDENGELVTTPAHYEDLDYNLTDNFTYFKEYKIVDIKIHENETYKQYKDIVLNLNNEKYPVKIEKNEMILLKDINVPIKRSSYNGINEIQVIDRNIHIKDLNIAVLKEENGVKKLLLRDNLISNHVSKLDEEAGLDGIDTSYQFTASTVNEDKTFQLEDAGLTIKQYWNQSDKSIDYTYYKRKFITKGLITVGNNSEITLKDDSINPDDFMDRGDPIQIIITSGMKVIVGGKEVTSFVDFEEEANYFLLGEGQNKGNVIKYILRLKSTDSDNPSGVNEILKYTLGVESSTLTKATGSDLTNELMNILRKITYVFNAESMTGNGNGIFAFTENQLYEFTTSNGMLGVNIVQENSERIVYNSKVKDVNGFVSENYKLVKTMTPETPLLDCPTTEYIKGKKTTRADMNNPVDIYTIKYDSQKLNWDQWEYDLVTELKRDAKSENDWVFCPAEGNDDTLWNDPLVAFLFGKYNIKEFNSNEVEWDSTKLEEKDFRVIRLPTISKKVLYESGDEAEVWFFDFAHPREIYEKTPEGNYIEKIGEDDRKKFLELLYQRKISNKQLSNRFVVSNDDYLIAYDPSCIGLTIRPTKIPDEGPRVKRISLIEYAKDAFTNKQDGENISGANDPENVYIYNDTLRTKFVQEKDESFYYQLYANDLKNSTLDENGDYIGREDLKNIAYGLVKAKPELFADFAGIEFGEGITGEEREAKLKEVWLYVRDYLKECTAAECISPSRLLELEMRFPGQGLRNTPSLILNAWTEEFYQRKVVQDFINRDTDEVRVSRRDNDEPYLNPDSNETKDKIFQINSTRDLKIIGKIKNVPVHGSIGKLDLDVYKLNQWYWADGIEQYTGVDLSNSKEDESFTYQNKTCKFGPDLVSDMNSKVNALIETLDSNLEDLQELIQQGIDNIDSALGKQGNDGKYDNGLKGFHEANDHRRQEDYFECK